MKQRYRSAALAVTALLIAAPAGAGGYDPALTPVPGDPAVTTEITQHENGRLAKRAFRKNGKLDGLFQEWDADGNLTLVAEWREDKGEGVWMYFHPNGIVRERSYVTRDLWHGPSEGWHANGQKAFHGEFDLGMKRGPFRYWSEQGQAFGPAVELAAQGPEPRIILAGFFPQGFNAWDVTFSIDLETMFVGTGDDDGENRRIMMRQWRGNAWSALEPAPFADLAAAEGNPISSHDGEYVYFSSDRHKAEEPENPNRDLYRVSRRSGWKQVERMTATPAYGEVSLSTAAGGLGVMWTDRRLDGEARIGLYEVAVGTDPLDFRVLRNLNELQTGDSSGEAYPVLAPDGSFLLFSNYDLAGAGTQEDMYMTLREGDGWSAPRALGAPLSSPGNDTAVQVIGGHTVIFGQSDEQGTRFYAIPMPSVLKPRKQP
ncbi:PD40 domain-containing protein [Porphyrobacter sp. YT40]|uniref:PD40 domain-containing protein n=1 Tax=Porphyrobacter sp. YT40 TaxID=2547601 RepID=UPI0011422372|nr:PD40 domain-containing protein [Porphyrobacter sp. YT40]QDH33296.1 hypothetical protein E2E27_02480 [Porphyrobacter sp. YT40]